MPDAPRQARNRPPLAQVSPAQPPAAPLYLGSLPLPPPPRQCRRQRQRQPRTPAPPRPAPWRGRGGSRAPLPRAGPGGRGALPAREAVRRRRDPIPGRASRSGAPRGSAPRGRCRPGRGTEAPRGSPPGLGTLSGASQMERGPDRPEQSYSRPSFRPAHGTGLPPHPTSALRFACSARASGYRLSSIRLPARPPLVAPSVPMCLVLP